MMRGEKSLPFNRSFIECVLAIHEELFEAHLDSYSSRSPLISSHLLALSSILSYLSIFLPVVRMFSHYLFMISNTPTMNSSQVSSTCLFSFFLSLSFPSGERTESNVLCHESFEENSMEFFKLPPIFW